MIESEQFTQYGENFIRHWSDRNMMIQKDGTEEIYSEAIDIENSGYTYTETDIPIEPEPTSDTVQKAEAYDYLTGRSDDE